MYTLTTCNIHVHKFTFAHIDKINALITNYIYMYQFLHHKRNCRVEEGTQSELNEEGKFNWQGLLFYIRHHSSFAKSCMFS